MNIFFIFPTIKGLKTVNHGVTALCGIIKQKGHLVDLYHSDKLKVKELYKKFKQKDYALCLISTVTNQWPYSLVMIKALRKISNVLIFVGGQHVTSDPQTLENTEELDGICIGEGDRALGTLLDKLESGENYYHIKNMWIRNRKDKSIIRNSLDSLIEDLDSLPFPDYSVFSRSAVLNYPNLMFSRGCPYGCTYCCNNYYKKIFKGKGKYLRHKSPGRAIEEVKRYIFDYKPHVLNFDDDLFVANKKWLYPFLDLYKAYTNIPFRCTSRPEAVNEVTCQKLKEANCDSINIGIESGNENIRKNVLKRPMTNESIINAFALAKKYGIQTSSFNLVGVPDETYENYWETIKLNRLIQPNKMQITIFYPYKGTELGGYAYEKGLVTSQDVHYNYYSKSILKMKQFPQWKIIYAQKFFQFNVIRERSLIRAIVYFLRYNLITSAYIRKYIKFLLRRTK